MNIPTDTAPLPGNVQPPPHRHRARKALLISGALAALAGCGSSSAATAAAPPATAASSTAAPAPSPLTCSTLTADNNLTASQVIAQLVSDQKSQDASMEQGWVDLTDGSQTSQGDDLSAAASALGSFAATQVAADGSAFATDVNTFLSDESGGLMPGWVSDYRAVQHDIAALAGDCDIAYTVPAGELPEVDSALGRLPGPVRASGVQADVRQLPVVLAGAVVAKLNPGQQAMLVPV
jgi:hypothetical protein